MPDPLRPYQPDHQARRRELEAQVLRLGRRRNAIGGAGTGGGALIGVAGIYLRRYFNSDAMHSPLFVAGVIGLAACVAGILALGWYVLQLNRRIEQISAEITMTEMRGH